MNAPNSRNQPSRCMRNISVKTVNHHVGSIILKLANFLANPNGHSFVASGMGTIVSTQGGQWKDSLIGEAANDACETSFLRRLAA